MKEAVDATGAEASIIFVPPPFAADSIMEAADSGIKFCVSITDGIPSQDMILGLYYMTKEKKSTKNEIVKALFSFTIKPFKTEKKDARKADINPNTIPFKY